MDQPHDQNVPQKMQALLVASKGSSPEINTGPDGLIASGFAWSHDGLETPELPQMAKNHEVF